MGSFQQIAADTVHICVKYVPNYYTGGRHPTFIDEESGTFSVAKYIRSEYEISYFLDVMEAVD